MKKKYLLMILNFILSVFTVAMLFVFSKKGENKQNGFKRIFPPHIALFKNKIDLTYNSYYIAGMTKDKVYLANYTSPTLLLASSYNLNDTHYLKMKVPDIKLRIEGIHVHVNYPAIYFIDRINGYCIAGSILDSCRYLGKLDTTEFSKSFPLSLSSCILRTYDKHLMQNILIKAKLPEDRNKRRCFVLRKINDGFFSTDGMLNYDQKNNLLVYVYYYFNRYQLLDSNLQLLFEGKTIDTTNKPGIKVAPVSSGQTRTLSSPPFIVNEKSNVYGNLLFICSGIKANNETLNDFNTNSVIDVYSLEHREYKYSFYIYKMEGQKMIDFRVFEKALVVVYGHFIVSYELNM